MWLHPRLSWQFRCHIVLNENASQELSSDGYQSLQPSLDTTKKPQGFASRNCHIMFCGVIPLFHQKKGGTCSAPGVFGEKSGIRSRNKTEIVFAVHEHVTFNRMFGRPFTSGELGTVKRMFGDYSVDYQLFRWLRHQFKIVVNLKTDSFASPANRKQPKFVARRPHWEASAVDALQSPQGNLVNFLCNPRSVIQKFLPR